MRFACIHTHTNFCDGKDDIETFCSVAHKKGLSSLGFSAHAPVTAKTRMRTNWHLPDDRLEEYLDSVRAAKKRWEGKLPVYLGLEVDFIENLIGPADMDYREMGLDYIIASVHYVFPQKGKPFTVDDSAENVRKGIEEGYGGDPTGMIEAYLAAEEAMIRAGGFDVLGHPDLVKVNNARAGHPGAGMLFSEDSDFYREKISSLAKLISAQPTNSTQAPAAEINTGGLNRGRIAECYPSLALLKIFREHGVPMVINADAHRAEDLDGHYEDAKKTLLAAGYSKTVLFAGRKDGKAVWNSIKL